MHGHRIHMPLPIWQQHICTRYIFTFKPYLTPVIRLAVADTEFAIDYARNEELFFSLGCEAECL